MAVKGHVAGRPTALATRMVFLAQHYANVQTVETFLTTGSLLKMTCKTHSAVKMNRPSAKIFDFAD